MTTDRTAVAPEIRDNAEAGRYEILVSGEVAGYLTYHRTDERLIIPRTVTLPEHRGQGLASVLVRHVLDEARREGLGVTTSCWYVRDWLSAHPEYRDVAA